MEAELVHGAAAVVSPYRAMADGIRSSDWSRGRVAGWAGVAAGSDASSFVMVCRFAILEAESVAQELLEDSQRSQGPLLEGQPAGRCHLILCEFSLRCHFVGSSGRFWCCLRLSLAHGEFEAITCILFASHTLVACCP
ncbi:hypothetical protein VPH35_124228 [Triticum aestivum]